MKTRFSPGREASTGAAVLMACACGAGAQSAKLVGMAGVDMTSKVTHSLLLSIGVILVISGLWRINRKTAYLAMTGFVALIAAAALTPPTVMSRPHLPWDGTQVTGATLYLVFGILVGLAFWLAFPFPRPAASATAMAGTVLATGCTCCMVTGAVAGLAVTAGGDPAIFLTKPVVFFTGIAIAAAGLSRLARFAPVPWLIAGALLTRYGGRALQLVGDWNVGEVNLRFIPGYLIYLLGAGLVLKGWAVAYAAARSREADPVPERVTEPAFEPS